MKIEKTTFECTDAETQEALDSPACGCASCKEVMDEAYKIAFDLIARARKDIEPKRCIFGQTVTAMLVTQYVANMMMYAIKSDSGPLIGDIKGHAMLHEADDRTKEITQTCSKYMEEQIVSVMQHPTGSVN